MKLLVVGLGLACAGTIRDDHGHDHDHDVEECIVTSSDCKEAEDACCVPSNPSNPFVDEKVCDIERGHHTVGQVGDDVNGGTHFCNEYYHHRYGKVEELQFYCGGGVDGITVRHGPEPHSGDNKFTWTPIHGHQVESEVQSMKLDGHHMISHMEFYSSPSKGLEFIRIFGAEIDGHDEIKYIECGSEPADQNMIETILVNDCEHEDHQDTYHEHCVLEYINGQYTTGAKDDEVRPGLHSLSFYFDCHDHDHDHDHDHL